MTGFTGHHSGRISIDVTATGIACAIFFGLLLVGSPSVPVRMNDTTYVLRYWNVSKVCDIKTLVCKEIDD